MRVPSKGRSARGRRVLRVGRSRVRCRRGSACNPCGRDATRSPLLLRVPRRRHGLFDGRGDRRRRTPAEPLYVPERADQNVRSTSGRRPHARGLSGVHYLAFQGAVRGGAPDERSPRRDFNGVWFERRKLGPNLKVYRDHLDEHITVEALAEIAQMPPERFGRAFRNATGMSVRRWQMDQRVRGAQRLLVDNPNENLTEVAALCGFADQSHFSRAFFDVIGLTPTAWLHNRD